MDSRRALRIEHRVRDAALPSRNVGDPDRSIRNGSVFTKNPMIPSSSVRGRPAVSVPTSTSSWRA